METFSLFQFTATPADNSIVFYTPMKTQSNAENLTTNEFCGSPQKSARILLRPLVVHSDKCVNAITEIKFLSFSLFAVNEFTENRNSWH